MFGDDVDTLSIKLRTSVTGPLRTIWNKAGKTDCFYIHVFNYMQHEVSHTLSIIVIRNEYEFFFLRRWQWILAIP